MTRSISLLLAVSAIALNWSCSAPSDGDDNAAADQPMLTGQVFTVPTEPGDDTADSDTSGESTVYVPPANVGASGGSVLLDGESSDATASPTEGDDIECASSSTPTELEGVVLAFTFDVSGSMGSYSQPYFAREFKWDPVVQATKAFFADTTSAGVSATLTFFPNDQAPLVGGGGGNEGDACDSADYDQPDVPLTPLPSDTFAAAIDAVTPLGDGDWRQGTPTGPALEGTIAAIEEMRAADPNTRYVIVLVTDGEPALCSNQQNDIDFVAGVAASVADEIPTYVIGLGNPVTADNPNPPQFGVDNLNTIAAAGGTTQAFVVDTDDPAQTTADFRAVIDSIRENTFSCALKIPAPPGGAEFDKEKVNVNYSSSMGETPLVYDPSCSEAFAWYYDDAENPTTIEMCDSVCDFVQNDFGTDGQMNLEFGCLTRVPSVK